MTNKTLDQLTSQTDLQDTDLLPIERPSGSLLKSIAWSVIKGVLQARIIGTATGTSGLAGGGDLTADRQLSVNITGLSAAVAPSGSADYLMIYSAAAAGLRKTTLGSLPVQAISTVNATVTTTTTMASGLLYVPIQMTTIGQSVVAADATGLSAGGPQYVLDNASGTVPAGFRDKNLNLIGAVPAGGVAFAVLRDASTVSGVWEMSGNVEPGLMMMDASLSATYTDVFSPFVQIDAKTSVHFVSLSSGFAAFVVDATTTAPTTGVTVSSTLSDTPQNAFLVDSTHVVVFYGQSGSWKMMSLTLTGSAGSFGLSTNTAATASITGASWYNDDAVTTPHLVQLSAGTYVASSQDGSGNVTAVVATVTGSPLVTSTIGSETTVATGASTTTTTVTSVLSSTKALVTYKTSTSSTVGAVVLAPSGVLPGAGSSVDLLLKSSSATNPASVTILSASLFMVGDDDATTAAKFVSSSISGTTITPGAIFTLESGAPVTTGKLVYSADSALRVNPHLWPITATTAGVWYNDSNTVSHTAILSVSGTTTSAPGGVTFGNISANTTSNAYTGAVLPQGTTEFLSVMNVAATAAGYWPALTPSKISGTAITSGTPAPMRDAAGGTAPTSFTAGKTTNGDYVITGNGAFFGLAVARSNGDAVNYRGFVRTPATTAKQIMPIVGTRAVVVTKTQVGSKVGAATKQVRVFTVEIAK